MPYQRCPAPFAWSIFCVKYLGEGIVMPGHVGTRDQLAAVNAKVNRIAAQPGLPPGPLEEWLIWPSRAWCHDYAVTKRHELLTSGWPSSSLLLTQCRTERGDAHMVLIANGLVMDNRTTALLEKTNTGYDWSLAEQRSDDPNHWEMWR